MLSLHAAKVGVLLPGGTVASSKYPGCPPAATYWPSRQSGLERGGMQRSTLTFSSRMSSGCKDTGGSMATSASTCGGGSGGGWGWGRGVAAAWALQVCVHLWAADLHGPGPSSASMSAA
jgi:hypothetical protein